MLILGHIDPTLGTPILAGAKVIAAFATVAVVFSFFHVNAAPVIDDPSRRKHGRKQRQKGPLNDNHHIRRIKF
jgi:hypothetical protein